MITVLSLVLLLVTITMVFAARGLWQYRRTGDTGWRAPSRAVDPSQAGARAVMALAFVMLLAAPILDLTGAVAAVFPDATTVRLVGLAVATLSAAAIVWAQLDLGASWRVGVDPDETTALVTTGAFAVVRNPIFTAMFGFVLGFVVAVPSAATVAGAVSAVWAVQWQVRRIEEPYLRRTHPVAYRDYAARTGRFLPGLGRLRRG